MLRNSFYNTLGGLVKISVGIISVPLLIQALNFNQYGLYVIIISITSFAILSEQSISTAITVFVAKDLSFLSQPSDETLKAITYLVILLSTIAGFILFVTTPIIANLFAHLSIKDKENLVSCCQISSLIVWFRFIQQLFIGLQQGYQKYGILNLISSFFNTFLTITTVVVAWYYFQIVPILLGQLAICIIFTLIHAIVCYKQRLFSVNLAIIKKGDNNKLKEIAIYTFRIWIGTLGGGLFTQGDKLILANVLSLSQVGLYAAMCNLVSQINTFSSLPVQPIISSLFTNVKKNSLSDNSNSIVLENIHINATIALGLGSMCVIFSPELLKYFISPNNPLDSQIGLVFIILISVYSIYSLNAVGYYLLFALRKEKINAYVVLLSGVTTLILITVLSEKYGIWGAVIGNSGYLLTLSLLGVSLKILNVSLLSILKVYLIPILVFIASFSSMFISNIIWLKILLAILLISLLIFNIFNVFFSRISSKFGMLNN